MGSEIEGDNFKIADYKVYRVIEMMKNFDKFGNILICI